MVCQRRPWGLILVLAFVLSPIQGRSDEIALGASDAVVLLRNGFVLHGRVTPLGDDYLITSGQSDQVRVPRPRVAAVCRDLEQAYLWQRDRISPGDIAARLKLATWCFQHELTARAADQLLAAFAIDPTDPQLQILEGRLRPTVEAPSSAEPEMESRTTSLEAERESATSTVTPSSLQAFTTTIQPLFLNRCGNYGCHGGSGDQPFRLYRPGLNQPITRRMTQRNLYEVMRYVNVEQPEASRLLAVVARPHGGRQEAILGDDSVAQYQVLLDWIRSLRTRQKAAPRRVTSREPLLQADAWIPGGEPQLEEVPTDAATEDPFDPEIFHRRHQLTPDVN